MDLVDMEENSPVCSGIHSTWQYVVNQDFCPSQSRNAGDSPLDSDPSFWGKLVATKNSATRKDVHVVTHELDFVEAADRRNSFDKILLLTKHCDHTVATGAGAVLTEPSLTVEGAGQALSLARRISTFCNDETRFLPELVVVAPLRRSIQTTLLSFPQYSPYTVRSVPWICHPATTGTNYDMQDLHQLQKEFSGLDYSPCYHEMECAVDETGATSAVAMLQRADSVLDWIREREEKIIVGTFEEASTRRKLLSLSHEVLISHLDSCLPVSSEATWLQAFGCAANYTGASSTFRDGELRVVGLNYI